MDGSPSWLREAPSFDVWFTQEFPVVIPAMGLALKFELSHGEIGKHTVAITLRDEDGKPVGLKVEGEMEVHPPRFVKSAAPTAQACFMVGGLPFPREGTYAFEILVDGRYVGGIPLHIVRREATAQAA